MNPPSPPPPRLDPLYFTANAMMMGTTASTAMPAMLRRLPKINVSSERRNLVDIRRDRTGGSPCRPTAVASGGTRDTASAADTETLPRQGHEHVFQVHRQ